MKPKILISLSILVSGGIIALAIFASGTSKTNNGSPSPSSNEDFGNSLSGAAQEIRPVDENDHVLGDRNAPVKIVEFSDFECPFCKRLHPTLKTILNEFDGQVSWVYRHFPLTSIHSKAQSAAIASECVARLGGNDSFWSFTDFIFENQSDLEEVTYREFARSEKIDENAFGSCLSSKEAELSVEQDLQDAINSGGRGTPYVVVINPNGELFPFSGALPYAQIKSIIENALNS